MNCVKLKSRISGQHRNHRVMGQYDKRELHHPHYLINIGKQPEFMQLIHTGCCQSSTQVPLKA